MDQPSISLLRRELAKRIEEALAAPKAADDSFWSLVRLNNNQRTFKGFACRSLLK